MKRLDPESFHIPVMLDECLKYLNVQSEGLYIDATMGGGSHLEAIVESLARQKAIAQTQREGGDRTPKAYAVGFDADERAVEHCAKRFTDLTNGTKHGVLLKLVHANFETIPEYVGREFQITPEKPGISGVLFDLGVSSYQFDYHERGFSFRMESALDMRFTPDGETAADVLNTRTNEELVWILKSYGDEPRARMLAQAIERRRMIAPFRKISDARDLVTQNIPPHHQARTLTRLFQALRIEVNRELTRLKDTLQKVIPLLQMGGRIVVMSYHSGEDRIVKDVYKMYEKTETPRLRILTKKPVSPSAVELQNNPRSRSARLRCAERIT